MSIVPVPQSITSFRDALGLALELSDEFAYAHAVVILAPDRRCVELQLFTGIVDNLGVMLGWLSSRLVRGYAPVPVLLISVRSVDGWSVYERDLNDFRFARATIGELGGELVDWLETDGELVRSFAHLVDPGSAWSTQARAEGALDDVDR